MLDFKGTLDREFPVSIKQIDDVKLKDEQSE